MPLSEEEKQALKEKYKQQRRAMWAGKRVSHHSEEVQPEEASDAEAETVIPSGRGTGDEEGQIDTSRTGATTSNPPQAKTIANTTPQESPHADRTHETFRRMREAASQRTSQSQQDSIAEQQEMAADNANSLQSEEVEQIVAEDNTPASDEALLIEKIREQREETWEGQSSIRSRRRKQRRKVSKGERKFWSKSEDKDKPNMLTWKLVLGVVGTISVLIGIGILLGTWFAG